MKNTICTIIVYFILLITSSLILHPNEYDTNYYKNLFDKMFANEDELEEMAKDPQGYIENLLKKEAEKALKEKIEPDKKYNVIKIDSLEYEYQSTAKGFGDLEDVKKFIQKYDINGVYDGYTLLYTYSKYYDTKIDIIEFLLENNADVYKKSINNKTALYSAVSSLSRDIVEILLKHYKNNDDINDEFLLAVNKEYKSILKRLLKKKFLFFGNKFKMNLQEGLEIALYKGNVDIAIILVVNGAKTDNFLYFLKLVFDKYLILIVLMIVLFSALVYTYKRRYNPTIYTDMEKLVTFKDKVNNIYIYSYTNYGGLSVMQGFLGNIFINNDKLKGYYNIDSSFTGNYISVYDFYDKNKNDKEYLSWYDVIIEEEKKEKAVIKFDCSLDDFINSDKKEINYTMEISNSKTINGVFEVNKNNDIDMTYFELGFKKFAKYNEFINILIYLFDMYHFNIKNNDKINSYINGDNKSYSEKKKELKINIKELLKKHESMSLNDIKIKYYDKLKDFYNADNIVYLDNKTICIYKRFAKIESNNNLTVNNISLIIDLDNEKLISPYFKDFVHNADEILKKYNSNFYKNIDNLIFLITEAGIILMKDKGHKKIFISLDDIKEHINKYHYLSYLFD
ncbi:ankyrin repeat domain-containing protein [Brachyspira sp.]|uniref:ankyrin repeat domain-containing protein n=1 Tax=Brachyspira sp. TaxID=1977261 RepID=UPI002628CD3B|nr:ankyrin repeat domain-containing protein [Brachyspira sp.]